MARNELTIITIETDPELTIEQLCQSCHVTPQFIHEIMNYGVIESKDPSHNYFDAHQLQRLRRLLRLQHDLDVNLAGAALAIDLLEQIDEMHKKIALLNRQFP